LDDGERRVLEAVLDQDFPGSPALLAQLEGVRARRGCDCGCGTIDLCVAGSSVSAVQLTGPLAPGEADVLSEAGETVGGLVVFVRVGDVCRMELFSWSEEPVALPRPDLVRPYVVGGRSSPDASSPG
jgi:hypothetical protein